MAELKKVIDETLASGLERPDAWVAVQDAGIDCDVNEFRSAYRRAQYTYNKKQQDKAPNVKPKVKIKAKAKK